FLYEGLPACTIDSACCRAAAWSVSAPSCGLRRCSPETQLATESRSCSPLSTVGLQTTSTALWPGPLELPKPTTDSSESGARTLNAIVRAASRSRATSASLRLPDSSTSTITWTGGRTSLSSRAWAGCDSVTTADGMLIAADINITGSARHRRRVLLRIGIHPRTTRRNKRSDNLAGPKCPITVPATSRQRSGGLFGHPSTEKAEGFPLPGSRPLQS